MHCVADAKPLHVASGSGAQDRIAIELPRKTETWLNVAVHGGRIAAVIATEELLVIAVEDGIGNVSFGCARETAARDDNAVQRISTSDESGGGIDGGSKRRVVVLLAEERLVSP